MFGFAWFGDPILTTPQMLLIACPLIFLAAFVDSIAGGGGLISLPAYMLTGIPQYYCMGTNKFSAGFGTALATFRYIKGGHIEWRTGLTAMFASLIASYFASRFALKIDADILRKCFVFALPIIAIIVLRKNAFVVSPHSPSVSSPILRSALIGCAIGAYDGLIGPGTGTFLFMAYLYFLKLDPVTATGNAKLVNLASNIGSLIAFALNGKILLTLGILTTLCSLAGGYLGAGLAIKKGLTIIKPLLYVVLTLLFVTLAYNSFIQ